MTRPRPPLGDHRSARSAGGESRLGDGVVGRAVGRILIVATVVLTALTIGGTGGVVRADSVVVHDAGADADRIGLIGDSTLAGVRWWADYGALERFDFVLDAESCRRTLAESCWSREDLRPATTLEALRGRAGEWGEVLVVMSGYNDDASSFADGVDAVVAEARRQDIGRVVWLTLRTDVDYSDPQELAGSATYRAANRVLHDAAERSDGYLQLADWATYSAGRHEWFGPDGVHFSPEGVRAITAYIAEHVDLVLAGRTITPDRPAWDPLREGDVGEAVADVQQALLDAGHDEVGGVDGAFGPQTVEAVVEFQSDEGLAATGGVGEDTARALGLVDEPDPEPTRDAAEPAARSAPAPVSPVAVEAAASAPPVPDPRSSGPSALAVAGLVGLALIVVLAAVGAIVGRRAWRRTTAGQLAAADSTAAIAADVPGPTAPHPTPPRPAPYDREREMVPVAPGRTGRGGERTPGVVQNGAWTLRGTYSTRD